MKIDGRSYRTIWLSNDGRSVCVIDQLLLPHSFELLTLRSVEDAVRAIRDMHVRGAPLIGATAAYGIALALRADPTDGALSSACKRLLATRPTAVNLAWAVNRISCAVRSLPVRQRTAAAYAEAAAICDEDVACCQAIGRYGRDLLGSTHRSKGGAPVNILTHCNAGWLACVDWGTALAPVYAAYNAGIPVHVWVDETRPHNQGARLTAWELGKHGVPYTVIVDSAGGHLMQRDQIDICITGTDRVAANGDVCNKIGTYLKALAANDNRVPFYVALPGSTIDWSLADGRGIPIEERNAREVSHVHGIDDDGRPCQVRVPPEGSRVANPAFDTTPARLITGFITERGICEASRHGLSRLYSENPVSADAFGAGA